MKLEIDLNDKEQLKRTEAELVRNLELVRAVLSKHEDFPAVAALGASGERTSAQVDKIILDLIILQKHQFNSSDIYDKLESVGLSRQEAKSAIQRMIDSKKIRVIEAGKGRRPTTFEKL